MPQEAEPDSEVEAKDSMSGQRPTIVLGTHNQKKRRELELLLSPFGFPLKTLADFPEALQRGEDPE